MFRCEQRAVVSGIPVSTDSTRAPAADCAGLHVTLVIAGGRTEDEISSSRFPPAHALLCIVETRPELRCVRMCG